MDKIYKELQIIKEETKTIREYVGCVPSATLVKEMMQKFKYLLERDHEILCELRAIRTELEKRR